MTTEKTAGDILGLAHAQVTAPRGAEEAIRAFYGGALGLRELAKPPALAGRGGAWFACGAQELHVGVEDDFRPQRKAHPALLVRDRQALAALRARLAAVEAPLGADLPIPGYERFETRDPFGNRLEFLCRVETGAIDTDGADANAETKERVRQAFGRAAEAYVTSAGHASGADLALLLTWAAPQPEDHALDVSTGGGHTALALAPQVARIVVSDLTPRMLAAARAFLSARGVTNAEYVVADAERLPFLDGSFDLVTVRIAAHHYADAQAATREMARALRKGGRLIFIDNVAPEDDTLDALLNEWERRRDPSHVRAYRVSQWRAMFAEAGLTITQWETGRKTHDYAAWIERMALDSESSAALERDMLTAPREARVHFALTERAGRLVRWTGDYVVIRAVKA